MGGVLWRFYQIEAGVLYGECCVCIVCLVAVWYLCGAEVTHVIIVLYPCPSLLGCVSANT